MSFRSALSTGAHVAGRRFVNGLKPPDWFHQISPKTMTNDLYAGIIGATIVLPQGIAFAAIAGLPPEYGFYTAMITPVIAAFFGSSWHTVSGPTTAISALVFGSLAGIYEPGSWQFIQAAITLSLIVGFFQWMLGVVRLGALVDFVSHSVMTGFITGAAMLIALSQIRHATGLDLPRPENLVEFASAFIELVPEVEWRSLLIASSTLLVGILIKLRFPQAPNYLIALFFGTMVSIAISGVENGVATIGALPSVFPNIAMPVVSEFSIRELTPPAFAIAIVGLLEAMSIARAIALRSGQDIDSNREFVGQGMSNMVGSFFQCYPGSASFTRSGVNYEAGAKTPLAAVFAAGFLALILFFVAPYFAFVPIPAMAGVILLVAYKLVDFKDLHHILFVSKTEAWIAAVTFFSTIFVDLEFAIYSGVFLSFLLFLNKSSRPRIGIGAPDSTMGKRMFRDAEAYGLKECPQLVFARLDGPLYFGSVEHVRRRLRKIERERAGQKHMILIIKGVGEIDLPGAELLIEEAKRRLKRGGSFHLQTKALRTIRKMERFHVDEVLSTKHTHLSKGDAIADIVPMLNQSICENCTMKIFNECPGAKK